MGKKNVRKSTKNMRISHIQLNLRRQNSVLFAGEKRVKESLYIVQETLLQEVKTAVEIAVITESTAHKSF